MAPLEPKDERARFQYLEWQKAYETTKPYQVFINVDDPDFEDTNLVFAEGPEEVVHDLRPDLDKYNLDDHGFAVHKSKTTVSSYEDEAEIKEKYLPETEQLLKDKVDDVDEVFIFDWRIRRHEAEVQLGTTINLNDRMKRLLPALHVHVDQSPVAVLRRMQAQVPGDISRWANGRIRIINVWRPLYNPVQDYPLAICQGSTVNEKNLVRTDHVRRHYTGETMYAKYGEGYRWNYISNHQPDEVLLFKNFDTKTDVKTKWCPHASFKASEIPADCKPRESIEVRAFVFTGER